MVEIATNLNTIKDDNGARLRFVVGDTRTYTFIVYDDTGTIQDISGWTVTVRCNSDGDIGSASNKIFQKDGTFVTDGTDGQFTLALTPTELPAGIAQEEAHLYVINTQDSNQSVVSHTVVDIFDNPVAGP